MVDVGHVGQGVQILNLRPIRVVDDYSILR